MAEHQEEFTSENIEEQLESLFHANDVQAFSTSPEKNARLLYYIQKVYQEQGAANTRSVERTWQQLQLRKKQSYNQYSDKQEQLYSLNDLKMANGRTYTMQNTPKPHKNMRRMLEILAALLVIGLLAGGLFTILHFIQQPGIATHPTATGTPQINVTSTPQTQIINTPQVVASPTPTVVGLGKDYAFVRNYQVWLALNGAAPIQATHLQHMDTATNMSWGQTIWFDNDHYLAFSLATWGPSGGTGCELAVNGYDFTKAVFLLNTQTMQLAQLSASGDTLSPLSPLAPYAGLWGNFFREDATHLLAWHTTGGNALAGLYRYDFTTSQLSMVIPATDLPETKSDVPFYTMRYNNGQLFYEITTPTDNNNPTSHFIIYSHSVTQPEQPSVKVLDVGSEIFCVGGTNFTAGMGPFGEPGWDISPDGKQLIAQTFVSTAASTSSKIQLISLQDGTSTALFAQVPTQELNRNVNLSWAPDSQMVQLVTSIPNTNQVAFYTARATDATVIQSYNAKTSGHTYWHSSSTAFILSSSPTSQIERSTTSTDVYLFTVGKPDGQILLSNADNFSWGLNS